MSAEWQRNKSVLEHADCLHQSLNIHVVDGYGRKFDLE